VRCRQGNDQSWKVVERRKREMFQNRRRTEESLCSVCVLAEIYIHKLFFDKRCAVFWDRHEQDRRRLVNKTRSTRSVAGNHGSHSNRKYRDVRGDAKFQHRTSKHCFSLTHSVVCRVGYTVSIRRKVCDSSLQVRDTARRIDSVVRAVNCSLSSRSFPLSFSFGLSYYSCLALDLQCSRAGNIVCMRGV
jgi:hypothetical protein